MNAITKNSQIVHLNSSVFFYDDVVESIVQMEDDETMVILKNPLPEKLGLTASSTAEYAAIFHSTVNADSKNLLAGMKSRSLVNAYFADRLKAMLDGYADVKDVETVYGPAIVMPAPTALELSPEALIPLIEKRHLDNVGYYAVIVDEHPMDVEEEDCDDRYFVRVIEKSMTDEEYEKHDMEMSSDVQVPFGYVSQETLDALRERYDAGIIGDLANGAWAFRRK